MQSRLTKILGNVSSFRIGSKAYAFDSVKETRKFGKMFILLLKDKDIVLAITQPKIYQNSLSDKDLFEIIQSSASIRGTVSIDGERIQNVKFNDSIIADKIAKVKYAPEQKQYITKQDTIQWDMFQSIVSLKTELEQSVVPVQIGSITYEVANLRREGDHIIFLDAVESPVASVRIIDKNILLRGSWATMDTNKQLATQTFKLQRQWKSKPRVVPLLQYELAAKKVKPQIRRKVKQRNTSVNAFQLGEKLSQLCVYGEDYGNGTPSETNQTVVVFGSPYLSRQSHVLSLIPQAKGDRMWTAGALPEKELRPILMVRTSF